MPCAELARTAALSCLCLGLAGCASEPQLLSAQAGQIWLEWELKDLQKALEAGAITAAEHDRLRARFLERQR